METIYVSTSTLDDSETERSILRLFEKAKYPERIFVGLSCSTESKSFYKKLAKSFKNKNVKLDYVKLKPKSFDRYGTGQARSRALSMYEQQDYVLQCDSHTNFEQDWDEFLIDTFKEAKSLLNHDKIVLTAYLGPYEFDSNGLNIVNSHTRYPFYTPGLFSDCYAKWKDAPLSEFDKKYTEKFYPCVKFNGNFAFGDKEFAKNPGTYKEAFFYDEEIVQGINLINSGFYMVYPNIKLPLTHLYYDHANEFGGNRKYFTQYVSDDTAYFIDDLAKKRYSSLINNREYVKKYEEYAKINLRTGLYKETHYVPEEYF
jgi:hypothetical protein